MFQSLSEKQKDIVFSSLNKIAVRACPGSGKTFAITARLADKISKWKEKNIGVATLSFTNVAWQEIDKKLSDFGVFSNVSMPHFLGTIDSFINRYIFLPFGHLVMKSNKRPILVGEPYSPWVATDEFNRYFAKLSYKMNGSIYDTIPSLPPYLSPDNINFREMVFKRKEKLSKSGYATQNDANYFSLRVLCDYSDIAQSLAGRFPILMIDEAQDTTEIQMVIIDKLIKAGLREIFIMGDPDQAIFEWNTADPQSFQSKCKEWKAIQLDECRRSSQNICDFVYKLSMLNKPAVSISPETSSYEAKPMIVEYDDLSSLKDNFLTLCKDSEINIDREKVAIVCRTKKFVDKFSTIFDSSGVLESISTCNPYDVWKNNFGWCKDICEGKTLIEQEFYKNGYKLVERGCFKILNSDVQYSREALNKYIMEYGLVNWRKLIHEIVESIPSTSCNVDSWMSSFSPVAQKYFNVNNLRTSIKRDRGHLLIDDIFSRSSIDFKTRDLFVRLGTIHSVKGETFEAMLVVLENKIKNTKYQTILNRYQEGNIAEEELRTLYVAITRPRKILMIGVPEGDSNMWKNFFLNT